MKISNKEWMKLSDGLADLGMSDTNYFEVKEYLSKYFERKRQRDTEDDLECVKCKAINSMLRKERCHRCGKSLKFAKLILSELKK